MTHRTAETVKRRVELLVAAKLAGHAIDQTAAVKRKLITSNPFAEIGMKHYLMTTESEFAKAVRRLVEMVVQNPMQLSDDSSANSGAAACRNDLWEAARSAISPCETRAYAKSFDDLPRAAQITSGEDRIRTCGPREGPRV